MTQVPWLKPVIPTHAVSRHTLRVRFCETDLMGIVHHANYLTYFEAARVEYLRKRGVSYARWAAEQAVQLPVIAYQILRGSPEHTICQGTTLLACVGADHRPRRLPPSVATVLCAPEL
jgi:acyl-CoA thioester hydrolase